MNDQEFEFFYMPIRTPPQHQTDPDKAPGQVKNEITLDDYYKRKGYVKSTNGCCHKTVIERCPECPYKWMDEPNDGQKIHDNYKKKQNEM